MSVHLSIISPVYRGALLVQQLTEEILYHSLSITADIEIILVEDGSPDDSWEEICKQCAQASRVKGLKLSRNFGQHYAITAGLAAAQGEWVIVMDCDLQDRPEEIPNLYQKAINEAYHLVYARRVIRQDNWLKKISSYLFYRFFSYLTDTHQDPTIANFGIYHRKVINAILSMNDHIRYFPTMSQWVGFKKGYLDVKHGKREEGKSTYTFGKLARLAIDNMIAFSDKPLWLTIRFGLFTASMSGFIGLYYLVQYLRGEIIVLGYASLIVSLWFLSGVIILLVGMVGVYIGKAFEKVKGRPVYIVEEELNFSSQFS